MWQLLASACCSDREQGDGPTLPLLVIPVKRWEERIKLEPCFNMRFLRLKCFLFFLLFLWLLFLHNPRIIF